MTTLQRLRRLSSYTVASSSQQEMTVLGRYTYMTMMVCVCVYYNIIMELIFCQKYISVRPSAFSFPQPSVFSSTISIQFFNRHLVFSSQRAVFYGGREGPF